MDSRVTLWLLPCTWHFGGELGPRALPLGTPFWPQTTRPGGEGGPGGPSQNTDLASDGPGFQDWFCRLLPVTISQFFQGLVFQCKMEIVMGSVPLSCCEH